MTVEYKRCGKTRGCRKSVDTHSPALRETGASVKELIIEVRAVLSRESSATPHLQEALDEAIAIQDWGTALGMLLDLYLFREVEGGRSSKFRE